MSMKYFVTVASEFLKNRVTYKNKGFWVAAIIVIHLLFAISLNLNETDIVSR